MKIEKNITNDGVSSNRGSFVIEFNEAQNKWIEFHLQQRGVDDVRYIQGFLVLDKKIPHSSKLYDHYNFLLPKDYLDLADARAIASTNSCKSKEINLFEIKTENLNSILQDEFNKPSFKWREAPFTVNSNSISIYTDGFSVDELLLNYYRYPKQIKLLNPSDPESKFDETHNIEWDDKSLDRILSLTAGEFDMNDSNPRFQIQNTRAQK
jgi:hypothetical protein